MSKITQDSSLKDGFFEDEDFEVIFGFDEQDAWDRLRSLPNTTLLSLSKQFQEELGITLGKNVTNEHPWREIKKEPLQKCLASGLLVAGQLEESLRLLEPGSSLLIEYLPDQSAQDDAFLVYSDAAEINEASDIVHKLELLERLKLELLTQKRPRRKWSTTGDVEREIGEWSRVPEETSVATEAQSVLPIRRTNQTLSVRSVTDVRDGYAELLPLKWKPINFPRRITDRGTQVRPQAYNRSLQTEPTFPSHAATQYQLDVADSKIDPSLISPAWLQRAASSLAQEAHFNLIELYRNEYDCISRTPVPAYRTPRIDEVLSFMNRALCIGRSVRALDWHPELSGIFAASYTFETLSQHAANKQHNQSAAPFGDALNRMTFEKCTVLLWSFEDPLEPVLELKTIREVTAVAFCPYDGELLVGGLSNGQIVLWDLKGELERIEQAKREALGSSEHRKQARHLMEYPAVESIDREFNPAAVSSLEHSSRAAITGIRWLPRNYFCTTTGHLKTAGGSEKLYRYMLTTSLDGSVCFWDLEFALPALQKLIAASKGAQQTDKTMYQRVNNLFYPTFKLICELPILSVVFDEAVYRSIPRESVRDFTTRVKHQQEAVAVSCEMVLKLGSFTGQLVEASWEGYDFEQGAVVNDEQVKVLHVFSQIHDGPVLALERNPLCRSVFLSIGGSVLAIWSEDEKNSPVFWRKKSQTITACRWSLDRVSVFFLGMGNGDFEIWDMSLKTFRETVCLNLGSEASTVISQHRLASARSCLAVADHNANIRILRLAASFVNALPDEEESFLAMINHELARKKNQATWVKGFYERNVEMIEAKIQAEIEARENRLQQQAERTGASSLPTEPETSKSKKMQDADKRMPLSERLEQKYQARHFQTLLRQLMARRNVSPERMARQMRPELERRQYNAEKREAIATNVGLASADFVALQKLLRPAEKSAAPVEERDRTEVARKYHTDIVDYQRIETDAHAVLRAHYLPELESFTEVLTRSKERRDKVCINVGTNMEHLVRYENKRSLRRSGVAPRTLLEDLEPLVEVKEEEEDGSPKEPAESEE
uniref:WD repeat-containing protein 63 n=1 Tax=Anopheles epiroticus TaxID=199890 RepID=A0A182PNG8_9DIPT